MNSPTSALEFSTATSDQVTIIKRHRIQTLRSLHRATTTSCALDDGVLFDDALYEDPMEPRRLEVDLLTVDSTTHDISSDNFDGRHESLQQIKEGDYEAVHSQNHVAASLIQKVHQNHHQKQNVLHTSHLLRIKYIVQRHKQIQYGAASKIQSVYRDYSARINSINLQKQRVLWCVYGIAATRIQKVYRGHLLRTVMRCVYEIAAMRIQMAYRNHVARNKSAINKMSMWHRHKLRKIVLCQSLIHRNLAMRNYENKIQEVIQIQACYKGYIQRKKYHGIISSMKLHKSAISRGGAVKKCNERQPTHLYQSVYPRKGFFLALKLQALYRGRKTREVLATAMASTMIQSYWRMHSSRNSYILKMSEGKVMASILIQAHWRSYSSRNFYLLKLAEKEHAAILIQSQWRSFSYHSAYLLNMMDTIIAQSVMRRWLASRQVHQIRRSLSSTSELTSANPAPSCGPTEFVDLSETSAAVLAAIVNLDEEQLRTVDDDGSYGNCYDIAECDQDEKEIQTDPNNQQPQEFDLSAGYTSQLVHANETECIPQDEEIKQVIPQDKAGIVKSVLWGWIRQQSEKTVTIREIDLNRNNPGCDNELVEDLSFFCRHVSLEEEMNEIQQSLKEEMQDLQMNFGTRWLGAIWNREGRAATLIQSLWRGHSCRKMFEHRRKASILIQSLWRGYTCRNAFTSTVTDVILAQSSIRRWLSCKQLDEMRNLSGETHPHDIDAVNKTDYDDEPKFCCPNMDFEEKMNEVQICLKEEMIELESICYKLFGRC